MTSASVRSPKNRFAFLKKDWRLYLMLILPLAQYVLFRYLPMEGVLIAFQKYNLFKGIWGSKWVGLENFNFVFSLKDFILSLKNTLFFILFHPGRVFGAAALQVVYWLILFFLLPWSAFAVPILGDWYVLFLSVFFIYRPLNKDFKVEDQIREAFPDNLPEEEYIP